eukprot:TRINITY_DN30661_c0_g1_i1.p2 TRINITY_DN30661_c0_g1~~TRINITY_DN30661_c0_g1_i1.p2  ORF type:complete len:100 (-),score=23.16 TRINITY_DN30661_c0_g1_i1:197-496(-)
MVLICIYLFFFFFFFNDTATTEIYTRSIVGSVRCVQETGSVWRIQHMDRVMPHLQSPRMEKRTGQYIMPASNQAVAGLGVQCGSKNSLLRITIHISELQ